MTSKNKNPLTIEIGQESEPGRHNKKKAPYMRNSWQGSEELQEIRANYQKLHQNKTFSITPEGREG